MEREVQGNVPSVGALNTGGYMENRRIWTFYRWQRWHLRPQILL